MENKYTASQRMKMVLELLNTNPAQLAKQLEKSKATIYHIVNGHTTEISNTIATEIAEAFPQLNKDFLLGRSDTLEGRVEISDSDILKMLKRNTDLISINRKLLEEQNVILEDILKKLK